MRESGRPEVWEQARFMWPDMPEVQDAWVEAIVSIETAFAAVNRLPHGEAPVDRVHPLAQVQTELNDCRTRLFEWARHPLAWPNGLD